MSRNKGIKPVNSIRSKWSARRQRLETQDSSSRDPREAKMGSRNCGHIRVRRNRGSTPVNTMSGNLRASRESLKHQAKRRIALREPKTASARPSRILDTVRRADRTKVLMEMRSDSSRTLCPVTDAKQMSFPTDKDGTAGDGERSLDRL